MTDTNTTELVDATHALILTVLAAGWTEETTPALGRAQRALLAFTPAPARESTPEPTPEPKRVRIQSKWRDLNSRMNGEEGYTLAIHEDRLYWLDQHPDAVVVSKGMMARGTRASERHCQNVCEVPVGTIVIYIIKNGGIRYTAGRIQEDREKPGQGSLYADDGVKHIGIRRKGDTYIHIVEIDSVRKEFWI